MDKFKTHHIKLASKYYDAVEQRRKNFEIRINDRDYHKGDWLVLKEWDGNNYTGFEIVRRVIDVYELDDIGWNGWVAMSIM